MMKRYFDRWWPQFLVGFVAFALYARTITADFLRWDDRQHILLNPWIEHNMLSATWTHPYYNMYIPVTYTFWTWLWHLAPNSPLQFHLANVVLHTVNTVLVYLLARIFLAGPPPPETAGKSTRAARRRGHNPPATTPVAAVEPPTIAPKEQVLGAIFAALIFAAHPLQAEVVAWISSGRDLLAGAFALIGAYWLFTRRGAGWMALTFVCFAIACFAKPSVAIMPVAFAFMAYGAGLLTRARAITLGTWLIPGLAASYITKAIQQLDADLRLPPMGLLDRILVSMDTLCFYIQKIFIPYPLAADYGRTREMAVSDDIWIYGFCAFGVLAVVAAIFWKRFSHRYLYYAGSFVLLLLPVLGIVPFQAQAQTTVADRYTYYALIGAGLLIGTFVVKWRWSAIAFAALALTTLCGMTIQRAGVWATNEGFFLDMLAKNEKSHVALSSLGVEYILTNRLPEAENVLNRATVLRPMDVIPRTNLAQLYLLLNRPDKVVNEISPLLDDKEFLRINQTETRALASAYRLAARAHWGLDLWNKASDFYCRWYHLDYENEDGKNEVKRFVDDAVKHSANLVSCEIMPPPTAMHAAPASVVSH